MPTNSHRRVLLLGDSICMSPGYSTGSSGYAPVVAAELARERIEVVYTRENGGSTRNLRQLLADGKLPLDVDLIHFNAGLHDIVIRDGSDECTVPLDEYAGNLRALVAALRGETRARLIWASTTPVQDEKHRQVKGFARREADVLRYNATAAAVMGELGIPVDDLHALLIAEDLDRVLGPDGCHPSIDGRRILATAVAARVRDSLGAATIRRG